MSSCIELDADGLQPGAAFGRRMGPDTQPSLLLDEPFGVVDDAGASLVMPVSWVVTAGLA